MEDPAVIAYIVRHLLLGTLSILNPRRHAHMYTDVERGTVSAALTDALSFSTDGYVLGKMLEAKYGWVVTDELVLFLSNRVASLHRDVLAEIASEREFAQAALVPDDADLVVRQ